MKIAILGYGKMGKTIEKLALQKGHTIVAKTTKNSENIPIDEVDVAIEFSSPNAAVTNIKFCLENNIPIVSGTTGWLENYNEMVKLCEKCNGSFLYASNFSIGVNLFFNINEYVSKLMAPWKEYRVSIEEIHHTEKKDAPSGTAITLAEGIINNSDKKDWKLNSESNNKININAQRIDDVKGTHIINYKTKIDTISLKHEAHSREGFAKGAILAAEWLQKRKGVYTMKDVLGINNK